MRRIRSWWALLAMTTMVLASLAVPLKGAAYSIPDRPAPVEGGDPDQPNDGPIRGKNQSTPEPVVVSRVIIIQPLPGVCIPLSIRVSLAKYFRHARLHQR